MVTVMITYFAQKLFEPLNRDGYKLLKGCSALHRSCPIHTCIQLIKYPFHLKGHLDAA